MSRDLPAALTAQIKETVETSLDPVSGSVLARRRKRLGALVLEESSAPAGCGGCGRGFAGGGAEPIRHACPGRDARAIFRRASS